MKLSQFNNADLMEITQIRADGARLIVNGNIMGSLPIRAVVTPAEMRKGLSLMSMRTLLATIWMFLFK